MKIKEVISLNTVVEQNHSIDATDLNGEKVMMNLEKGKYFALNDVGSRIWDIIHEPIAVKDIVSTLLNEYEIDNETCEKNVMSFLEGLQDAELITTN